MMASSTVDLSHKADRHCTWNHLKCLINLVVRVVLFSVVQSRSWMIGWFLWTHNHWQANISDPSTNMLHHFKCIARLFFGCCLAILTLMMNFWCSPCSHHKNMTSTLGGESANRNVFSRWFIAMPLFSAGFHWKKHFLMGYPISLTTDGKLGCS